MTNMQGKMWYTLIKMSGEDVARAFTNFFGNQILSEEFYQFLVDEGYMESDDEEWEPEEFDSDYHPGWHLRYEEDESEDEE